MQTGRHAPQTCETVYPTKKMLAPKPYALLERCTSVLNWNAANDRFDRSMYVKNCTSTKEDVKLCM